MAFICKRGFLGGSAIKNPPASVGDMDSIPGLGRSYGGGNGNSPQYFCLGNPSDREAWRATVTKSRTQLRDETTAAKGPESVLLTVDIFIEHSQSARY